MVDYALLKKLCLADGISGDEGAVRELIIGEIKGFADWEVDSLGNLLVHKKGRHPAKTRLMLSAHMDEVGMMVTDITQGGFLKFDEVGGIDRRVLIGKAVTIGRNNVHGVIGIKPLHLCKGEESKTIPEYGEMNIDIGADSMEQALSVVSYGDSVRYAGEFLENDRTINAKAIDDRFGCYVMIELIKIELLYDADFAFTVQEEVGLRGAMGAAFAAQADTVIVLEGTTAGDMGDVEKVRRVCEPGLGVAVSFMDHASIATRSLYRELMDLAESRSIAHQVKRGVSGGNDAGAYQRSKGSVRTCVLSVPCRYIHGPSSVVKLSDAEAQYALAKAYAEQAE